MIHRQRQKKDGIMFGELKKNVIEDSFTMGNDFTIPSKEEDNNNKMKMPDLNKPLLEQIIISNESIAYSIWFNIYVFCCLISSYFYAYIAAFEMPIPGTFLYNLNMVFEAIFAISFLLCFIVDYQPPDSQKPVKDVTKIAMRYIFKGNFVYDFFPLLPFTWISLPNGNERLFYIIKIMRMVIGL